MIEHSIHSRPKHHRPQFLVEYRMGLRTLKTLCSSPTRTGYSAEVGAKKALEKYPVGSRVLLYVDPNRPERAYLWLPELFTIAAEIIGAILFAAAVVAGFSSCAHRVAIPMVRVTPALSLGETEVTVAQFRRFVEETGYVTDAERGTPEGGHTVGAFAALPEGDRAWNASASWRNPWPHFPERRTSDDDPVLHVSWNDAQAFCSHHGFRLPAEAEWRFVTKHARLDVAEWCADAYAPGSEARLVCGRSWVDPPGQPMERIGMEPYRRRDFIGFRCAMDSR